MPPIPYAAAIFAVLRHAAPRLLIFRRYMLTPCFAACGFIIIKRYDALLRCRHARYDAAVVFAEMPCRAMQRRRHDAITPL